MGQFRSLYESDGYDYLLESDDEVDDAPKTMTDEKLKVESLKIAISISKLMSDVQVDDVVKIAQTVADFIRNRDIEGLGGGFGESGDDDDVDVSDEL